ncbi:hypothetical protein Sjap_021452 [Stephania japonica]|uniref:ABC transporter domain-containing protein n=1 Tax=Stephania japonica TaxID=461633 RepID=A0AAP0HU45_9MAGN
MTHLPSNLLLTHLKTVALMEIVSKRMHMVAGDLNCVTDPEGSGQIFVDRGDTSSFAASSYPITLKFIDICYRLKREKRSGGGSLLSRVFSDHDQRDRSAAEARTVLEGVTGMVSPGEILAVLGPSGSGKSTLLTALAGRLNAAGFTGTVLANDQPVTKSVLKRTGFVAQDDVLYPHLTVRETLIYCSLLRLPQRLSKKDKIVMADSVISELGLAKCEDTIIGNSFIRGVSGGERKRVSIAHEMLVNPSMLLLDEPTSGLDSTAAHRLVSTLVSLAHKGKTVVTSVHQPSSRVFQMFTSVLLLSEGQCLYFGKATHAMDYFASLRCSPSFPMNPADFLLDLANGVVYPTDAQNEGDKPNIRQTLVASYNNLLAPKVKEACMTTDPNNTNIAVQKISNQENKRNLNNCSWFNQFSIILQRSLKERRHESFNSLKVFHVIAAAVLAGSMWWHSNIRDVQDRLGLLFTTCIFWGVLPSFTAVFAFPQDRAIFVKERSSGMYTLSSYFMARVVGDLLMDLALPTAFITIVYWMAGLRPDIMAFLFSLAVILLYVMVAIGFGQAMGAAIMDAKQASTAVTVVMFAFVMTGGFYVHNVPACLAWMKYTSFTFYTYKLLINAQYGEGNLISLLLGCHHSNGGNRADCKIVEGDVQGQIHPLMCVGVLALMLVGYRLLAYAALRRVKARGVKMA